MVEFDDNKKELKRNEMKMDELKRDNHKLKGQIEDLKREKVSAGECVVLPSMVCCIMYGCFSGRGVHRFVCVNLLQGTRSTVARF
jgi:cell division protein FtsB